MSILELLIQGETTTDTIRTNLNLERQRCANLLQTMKGEGLIVKPSLGIWSATPSGQQFFEAKGQVPGNGESVPSPYTTRTDSHSKAKSKPAKSRRRILPADPKEGTLRREVLEFVRISGGSGDAACLTRLCKGETFPLVTTSDVSSELEVLADKKFIKRRTDVPPEIEAYEALSAYSH